MVSKLVDVPGDVVAAGRFLGGRPLFGYRLVDAGPHPNPMHAKWAAVTRMQRVGYRR
ncbi:hypothetical protein [Dactylosporangium matsuzakiense]|uniref:hypothetical protein n=1 Tax=Dactylosporangium matsuzakiense TaxID=53360 RepID=UPI0022F3201B|nr:hypothetical protein [Dactylosporangium matsuzakiense]